MMKMPNPKRWWSVASLGIALLLAGVLLIIRLIVSEGMGISELQGLPIVLGVGALSFPIGLLGAFPPCATLIRHDGPELIAYGWILYAVLLLAGAIWPKRWLLATLTCALLINIVGCQSQLTQEAFRWSP
jgi:hypothetical protein